MWPHQSHCYIMKVTLMLFLLNLNSFMTGAVIIQKPVRKSLNGSANQWTGFYMITASVMKELSNHFSAQYWRLETRVISFYDFIKMTIQWDLVICNSWHLPFLTSLIHFFKKKKKTKKNNGTKKQWKLDIIGYWVIRASC